MPRRLATRVDAPAPELAAGAAGVDPHAAVPRRNGWRDVARGVDGAWTQSPSATAAAFERRSTTRRGFAAQMDAALEFSASAAAVHRSPPSSAFPRRCTSCASVKKSWRAPPHEASANRVTSSGCGSIHLFEEKVQIRVSDLARLRVGSAIVLLLSKGGYGQPPQHFEVAVIRPSL